MKNLLILFGGVSGEHEVSRLSTASVLKNIHKGKYNIITVGITKDGRWLLTDATSEQISDGSWESLDNKWAVLSPDRVHHGLITDDGIINIDVCFPVMHGDFCEDGCIQGLFELSGIPYVGSGVLSSSVGMDKGSTKLFACSVGVPQADWIVLNAPYNEKMADEVETKFSYPVFIKPSNAGSSLGVTKVLSRGQLKTAIDEAAKVDTRILCEEFIDGYEVECAVLGNEEPKASVVGMITPSNEFYDYNAKYIDNASGLTIPAPIQEDTAEKIREYALKIYTAILCKGLSRVDFFVHKKTGDIYFNEINTLPGFTSISMYPKLWAHCGIEYSDLIDQLIQLAVKK